ncbi:MAG: hypothetical protein ACFFFY_04705 [Promethearchaeota archaeon]
MSIINYPPQEVINPSMLGKKNYEHIILWMLCNNEECEWFSFLQNPLEIPTSTLARHLNTLISEGYINKISKGHYKITTEGRRRFHDISKTKEKKRKLSFPPKTILKSRNYDHWILWMVYNNNYCRWSDFLEEPLSINQSSLSKTIRLMIKNGFIRKDIENKEYRITQTGKSEYSRVLKYYDLDYHIILEEESKRIEEISKNTIKFFNDYNVKDEHTQFRFLNNALKMDYNRVKSVLKNDEDFYKILLFLSINHPSQYPDYISSEVFSKKYGIKENTLTYYIDEIVDRTVYPIKFFKLVLSPEMHYYFQENEKLESILRAITKEKVTEFTYLNKLFTRSLSFNTTIEELLEEICTILFNEDLKESLREFITEYINYLAYKIAAVSKLNETYDKLEGIIWQNIADIFQPEVSEKIKHQYEVELKKIEKNINISLNKIDLYYSKIKILLYFGQYDKILALLDNMLKIFPDDEKDIKILKAYVFKRMQDLNTGLKIINDLVQKYPENSELLNYKAYWLQYLNRKDESLKIIRELIEKHPDVGLYHDTYGEILMYFEEYKSAVEQLQQVLKLVNEEWYLNQTYIKLGICYKELGDINLAVENLKKGKEMTNKASVNHEIKQKWHKIAELFLAEIREEIEEI